MLLINPANSEYGGTLSRFTPLSLPMSIGCLAAALEQAGHAAQIWDEELGRIDSEAALRSLAGDENVFGITVLTAQVARAYDLCRKLKEWRPGCTVIMGGYHVTALPEEPFEHCPVDFVVRGEGERTLVELCEKLGAHETDFSSVLGLTYRAQVPKKQGSLLVQHDSGLRSTPERPLIKELSELPTFPYQMFVDMLDKGNENKARKHNYDWGFIVTSRGCPYRCNYCAQRMMTGNTYRWKPIDMVVHELDTLVNRFGAKSIFFLDDNFCFKRSHTIELCERIRDSGLGKKCEFSLQTRADNFYKELVPVMREAGFTSVGFGMETATDKLLDIIGKEETVEQHVQAIDLAKKNGMEAALFMIYGLPTESHEDRKRIYQTVKKMGLTHCKFNNLMPYPGTPMYNDLKKTGRFNQVGLYDNFVSALSEMGLSLTERKPLPYVPEESSEIELIRDVIRYNLLLSLRWSVIKGVLHRRKGPGWFVLQEGWWAKPGELWPVIRFAWLLLGNLLMSLTPLWILEPWMHWRKPTLQRRVPKEKVKAYVPSGWSKESYFKKMV
jgi:anaerobic magnesium-protoporphyrin IX monomethyl ester cyclase